MYNYYYHVGYKLLSSVIIDTGVSKSTLYKHASYRLVDKHMQDLVLHWFNNRIQYIYTHAVKTIDIECMWLWAVKVPLELQAE